MSKNKENPRNSTNNTATPANDIAEAEAPKTEQAAAKATAQVADVMAPETIVVDEPPPNPDYPHYRVRPGERIVLADLDPDLTFPDKSPKAEGAGVPAMDVCIR